MGTPKLDNQVIPGLKAGAKPYGKVVLTLKNCLLPEEKLSPTPSQLDGLDQGTETDLRILGCELIQTAGILLKLPQVAMATGQVLFQRFYYSKSFVRHPMEPTAMGCVCLASKIEEAPRRIRDVINVFYHIKQVKNGKTIQPMILDQNYIALKTQVIKAERRVLKELGFCVHVKHPHKIIVMYLQVLSFEKHQALMQLAWNYMNDSLRTDVFVRYQPETVACACIYLTARRLRISLPKNPPWYAVFRVKESDIQDVCKAILRLYKRPKPNAEELERRVEELMKQYQEARVKARTAGTATPGGGESPASSSRASSPVPSAPGPIAVTTVTTSTSSTNHNSLPPPAVTLTTIPSGNSSSILTKSSTSSSRSNSHYGTHEGSHHSSHRHRRSRRSSASPSKKSSSRGESPQRWASYSSKNNHNNSSSVDRHVGRERSRSNSLSRSPPPTLPPPPVPASSVTSENSSSSRRRRNKSSRKSRRSSSGSPSASGQTRSRSRSRERSRKKTSSRSKSSRRSYSRSVSPQPLSSQTSALSSQNSGLTSQAQLSNISSIRQSGGRTRERSEKVRYRSRSRSHERDRSRDERFYDHYDKSLSSAIGGVKLSSTAKHHHRDVDDDYLSSSLRSTSNSGRSSAKDSRR
ncbi:cyclin-L1 isoform X2 [Ischnura elegans]|uniref:cyclin-L1 isoform X2 n=1 Tax=Ischnura elegans TaxID=197161 RepID=UPI001ED88B86|nr:cyclin-L1 isoform X2 [Ischnura elegans]